MQAKPNIVDVVLAGGVAALALALAALPFVGRSFGEMYREFGEEVPLLTQLATSYWFPLTATGTTFVVLALRGPSPKAALCEACFSAWAARYS